MKIQKTITLDIEVFMKIREKNLNLSEILNSYLKEFLNIKEDNTGKRLSQLKSETTKQEASLLQKRELIKQMERELIQTEGVPFET